MPTQMRGFCGSYRTAPPRRNFFAPLHSWFGCWAKSPTEIDLNKAKEERLKDND